MMNVMIIHVFQKYSFVSNVKEQYRSIIWDVKFHDQIHYEIIE